MVQGIKNSIKVFNSKTINDNEKQTLLLSSSFSILGLTCKLALLVFTLAIGILLPYALIDKICKFNINNYYFLFLLTLCSIIYAFIRKSYV